MKSIEVVVSPVGAVRVETRGFAGAECRQADEFLRKALGHETAEQITAEYHTAAESQRCEHEERS